jgi:CheY-like chemotaxis protein
VLDLRLPDADGTILLRRLKRDSRHTRVAIVTGAPDLSRYGEMHHFKPDAIFYKPINAEKLIGWLQSTRAEYEHAESEGSWVPTPPVDLDPELQPVTAADPAEAPQADARRRDERFAGTRTVLIRATGDTSTPSEDVPAHPARLLDCSRNGISIAFHEEIAPGEWFSLSTDASADAFSAVYRSCHCTPMSDGTHRVGAELLGVLGGPDFDPHAMLESLRGDAPH